MVKYKIAINQQRLFIERIIEIHPSKVTNILSLILLRERN